MSSISPGERSLLPQIPSSVTPLLSMMEVQWHNFLLARMLWYVMHMESKAENSLSTHFIKSRGAMNTIIIDGGKYEISKKVADLLRSLFIKQYESEPYHQHQNKAEQCYGVVKRYINTLMNVTVTSVCL